MKFSPYPKVLRAQALALAAEGKTNPEIMEALNLPKTTIQRWCANVRRGLPPKEVTPAHQKRLERYKARRELVYELLAAGMTSAQIADEARLPRGTVNQWLKEKREAEAAIGKPRGEVAGPAYARGYRNGWGGMSTGRHRGQS